MRRAALVLMTALALTACGPKAQSGAPDAPGANGASNAGVSAANPFPNLMTASYRAEGTISGEHGDSIPVVMIRSGSKTRMEMNRAEGQMVMVSDMQTHEAFSIVHQGGRTMAMRMNTSGTPQISDPTAMWQAEMGNVTAGGPCLHAGQTGNIWNTNKDGVAHSVCVTGDGIMLWVKDGDRTVWDTTSVVRGPQDASQFELPAGVQVMDLGNITARAAAMAAAARGAQKGQ